LDGGELFNGDGGRLDSQNSLSVSLGGVLDNQGGRLLSDAGVTLKGASLDNSRSGVISAKGAVDIRTGV
ncbi:hypothetical protein ACM79B_30595, partial [Pseudomonas aeruginosa]